jgi:hypothetical protein
MRTARMASPFVSLHLQSCAQYESAAWSAIFQDEALLRKLRNVGPSNHHSLHSGLPAFVRKTNVSPLG